MSLLKLNGNHYMMAQQIIDVKLFDNVITVSTARGDHKIKCETEKAWQTFVETLKENLNPPIQEIVDMKKVKGFKANQDQIAKKEGVSKESAGAILANATRKASPAAKKKNPNLRKVK